MLSLWTVTPGAPWPECSTTGTPWERRVWGNGRGPRWPGPSHLVHFWAATARKHHLSTGEEKWSSWFSIWATNFISGWKQFWDEFGCINVECRNFYIIGLCIKKVKFSKWYCVFQWRDPTSSFPWRRGRGFGPRYERPHARLWRCFKNFITHRNT